MEHVGVVLNYKKGEGYGWIRPVDFKSTNGEDVFISHREIMEQTESIKSLNKNDKVVFNLSQNQKGFYAKELRILLELPLP
jgi:cold shock CspA family protein